MDITNILKPIEAIKIDSIEHLLSIIVEENQMGINGFEGKQILILHCFRQLFV